MRLLLTSFSMSFGPDMNILYLFSLFVFWNVFDLAKVLNSTESERDSKVLSLFTVVKFANTACSSSLGPNGTCYTATQCRSLGGAARGSCAHSFGVCCVFSSSCGDRSYQNGTYLMMDSSSPGSCDYRVCSRDSGVCKLRLDFESLTLTGPQEDNYTSAVDSVVKNSHSIVGQCLSDTLIIVPSEGPAPPVICGENSGQHMYATLSGARDSCVRVSLFISGATFTRSVNIKTTQVRTKSEIYTPAQTS